MDFTSYTFLILMPFFYLGLIISNKVSMWFSKPNLSIEYIVLSSLILYGLWSPSSLVIILYVIVITIIFVGLFQRSDSRSKFHLLVSIVLLLLPLLTFKYTSLIQNSLGINYFSSSSWFLPLGISFFVFTAIGVVSDVYTGKECHKLTVREISLLISYWPHLAAGPILRSKFITNHKLSRNLLNNLPLAIVFIAGGAAKKLLIADNLGAYVNHNIAQGIAGMDGLTALLTILGFGGQIYADFSGYSEMAIGFSLMVGLKIPANFNYPYSSYSVIAFWRTWHISLSTWFRDYVYIPLGGNKKGVLFSYFNILIVFIVSGLWHGASIGFLVWGAIHGVLLIINRIYNKHIGIKLGLLGWLMTYLSVNLAWSFFRLDIHSALLLNQAILNPINWLSISFDTLYYTIPIVFIMFLLFIDHKFKYYTVSQSGNIYLFKKRSKSQTYVYLWILFTMAMFLNGKDIPFIYFEF